MTVSNEVLAERIEGFTRQNLQESQQVRRDLSAVVEQMGRVADSVTSINDRVNLHEQLPGHPIALLRIGAIERTAEVHQKEIEQLKLLAEVKNDVAALRTEQVALRKDVNAVIQVQQSHQDFNQGRQSALSAGEKIVLLLIAASGPMLAIVEKL